MGGCHWTFLVSGAEYGWPRGAESSLHDMQATKGQVRYETSQTKKNTLDCGPK